jgi:diadenosine tetraphosphate (Ap4A) HIT family hydrolase
MAFHHKEKLNKLFHQMANHEAPIHLIGENVSFTAILDIDPIVDGHCLIIPKRNIIEIHELQEKEVLDLHQLIKKVCLLLTQTFNPNGISIMQNGGENNEVSYLHFHLIPRNKETHLHFTSHKKSFSPLKDIQKSILSSKGV